MARKNKRIELICQKCNKCFSVPPCRLRAGNVKYCSTTCAASDRIGNNHPLWKGGNVERKCQECDKTFYSKPKDIKAGRGKFCSKSCMGKSNGRRVKEKFADSRFVKHCVICNTEIHVKPSHADSEGTYCSQDCKKIGFKNRFQGINNPNYKDAGYEGYSKYSKKAVEQRRAAKKIKNHSRAEWELMKKIYGFKCACCKMENKKLTKDHIIPITKGGHNGIDNIQPLCARCNTKKFTQTIRYVHQLHLHYP